MKNKILSIIASILSLLGFLFVMFFVGSPISNRHQKDKMYKEAYQQLIQEQREASIKKMTEKNFQEYLDTVEFDWSANIDLNDNSNDTN